MEWEKEGAGGKGSGERLRGWVLRFLSFFFFFKYFFATWHTFGSHMAQMWQPRHHLTDQWMKNVTDV